MNTEILHKQSLRDNLIEKRLQRDMGIIRNALLKQLKQKPLAILLWGSYGRGEGAWEIRDGSAHPYNDYDVAVITDEQLSEKEVRMLSRSLTIKANVELVDLIFYRKKTFNHLRPIVPHYQLLYGSQIVFGDSNLIVNAKPINSAGINRSEMTIFYNTITYSNFPQEIVG